MANPTDKFPKGLEPNIVWKGPTPDILDLHAHHSREPEGDRTVSVWELQPGEYQEVVRTGRVYLFVYGMHPPVYVGSACDFELEDLDEPSYLAKYLQGKQQAELQRLREALKDIRDAGPALGTGDLMSAQEIAEEALSNEAVPPGPSDPPGPVHRRIG